MVFCLAVFRSRTQVMEFIEYFQSGGIDARAVNTPAEAKIGCGISARFPKIYLPYAIQTVNKLYLNTLTGFYEVRTVGNRTTVIRL